MIMRPLASATRAAIAGAKGGSSQARKPVEAPDSLHSTDYARILDLISEGEIVGLVNGLQSVFLEINEWLGFEAVKFGPYDLSALTAPSGGSTS